MKKYRGQQLINRMIMFTEGVALRKKRQGFKKLNQQYQIVVKPPQDKINYTSVLISPKKE